MWYNIIRICYSEIDELQQEFSKVKASLENEIAKLGETFNSFSLDTETYDGQSATAMRSYIQNIHGSVLDLFEVLGFQMELSIRMYADNFGSQVDGSEKAVLQTEYIDNVLTQMLACRDTFDSIDVAVKALSGEYAEFITSAPTNGGLIFENFNEALRFIDKTSNSVGEFDSSMSGCFTAVNELILAIYQACQTKIPYNEVAKDFAYSEDMSFPWMEVLEKPIDFSSLSNLHLSEISESEIPKKSVYYYYDEIANRFVSQTVEAENMQKLRDAFFNPKYVDYLISDLSKKDIIMDVVQYELTMSKNDLKKMSEFLKPLEAQDDVEIRALVYFVEEPFEEPFREVFIKYLDEFKIGKTNSERGYFSSTWLTVNFDVVEDRSDARGAYYTFFHEVAHAIDYTYARKQGKKGYYIDTYTNEYGQTLSDVNIVDATKVLLNEINLEINNLPQSSNMSLLEKNSLALYTLYSILHIGNEPTFNLNKILQANILSNSHSILTTIETNMSKKLLIGADNECAADIYGGLSNNLLIGEDSFAHRDYEVEKRLISDWVSTEPKMESYWLNEDGTIKRETNREMFAEYFGRVMAGKINNSKTDDLASINTYLSNSADFAEELIVAMGG